MLNGRPALIVEEEFLIALDIQRMLEALGVGQTLFARNAAEAYQLQAHWPDLCLAIVELRMADTMAAQLQDGLTEAGIPIVFTTSDIGLRRPALQQERLIVSKPIPEDVMASAVSKALANRP